MPPRPHGGLVIDRMLKGPDQARAGDATACRRLLDFSSALAGDVMNIATGVLSPLMGFMGRRDLQGVLDLGRLLNRPPSTIPIVLDVSAAAATLPAAMALAHDGQSIAVAAVHDVYAYDKEAGCSAPPTSVTSAWRRRGSGVNEKTCPHGAARRLDFSQTSFRTAVFEGAAGADDLVHPGVAAAVRWFERPVRRMRGARA